MDFTLILAMHEKIFIVFMMSSLVYMLVTLKLVKNIQPNGPQTPVEEYSLKCKKICFAFSIARYLQLNFLLKGEILIRVVFFFSALLD
jgi:post-GPI attachment to proteins factor 2